MSVDTDVRTAPRSSAQDLPLRLAALTHTLGRFKQQIQQANHNNPDWGYDAILYNVVTCGPLRSGALAELVQVDPSTMSRQVAALVRDGLVERRADPQDGRATLLQATDLGRARHVQHCTRRDEHYRMMLAGWTKAERAQFADYLARFTAAFDSYKHVILADVTGTSPGPAAGKDSSA
jgi:DNA-binding MarR family transcriptional regulator